MVEKNAGVKEKGNRKKFNYKSSKTQFIPAKIGFFVLVWQANFSMQQEHYFSPLKRCILNLFKKIPDNLPGIFSARTCSPIF